MTVPLPEERRAWHHTTATARPAALFELDQAWQRAFGAGPVTTWLTASTGSYR
ncbi:hypothetical protein ACIGW3_31905 [Streptomyces sp. NPDC053499]|uniref:hypothetical protein n=1 Tax=Streptomyces sp. NPDC053499 TaxID=3365707 RepID=UPI0037D44924